MICKECNTEYSDDELFRKKYICSKCGTYFRIPARIRIKMVADRGSFSEMFEDICLSNEDISVEYSEKLADAREKTGNDEAVIVGEAKVLGEKIVLAVCDSYFMMGSMGYVVGEKITRAIEYATTNRLPVFVFCCSGGARMQEGLKSLMQMEKTSLAVAKHDEAGLFYSTILTDPTTGGVTASFAMLGDVIMAEKDATIGFTGKRVIRQTIGKELPKGFQGSEFQCKHGMIDGIVERNRIRKMIQFLVITNKVRQNYVLSTKITQNEFKLLNIITKKNKDSLSAWQKVKLNRRFDIYQPLDFVQDIFDVFVELRGDRFYGDDSAVAGGIAMLGGLPITVIATRRGKTAQEIVKNNYGMPSPEGYRKALRLMKQADKYNRPIITFINTPGAYPGEEAEERGQGEAIARNLFEMSRLTVPVLSIIVGEAGSGGALALAVANEVWMLETATYSILSPEGFASIMWKDSTRAEEAAGEMNITAERLQKIGIIDKTIKVEDSCSIEAMKRTSQLLRKDIIRFLGDMSKLERKEIRSRREMRFRNF